MNSEGLADQINSMIQWIKNKWTAFYRKYAVQFLCVVLGILIIILIYAFASGAGISNSDDRTIMERVRSKDVVECSITSINNFFYTYYNALANGDTEVLESSFDNPKKAKISTDISEIVDKISIRKIYVTPGLEQNEVAVFVSYDIYFQNISTSAPAVDSFYIEMNSKKGEIKIMTDMYSDSDINEMLTLISYRNPVRTLLSDTEKDLYDLLNNNPDLRNLYVVMSSMTSTAEN